MKKHIKILKKKLKNFDPKLKEECGVFGISNAKDASALTALGLHALQHRGQEGCGIVSFDGEKYYSEKRSFSCYLFSVDDYCLFYCYLILN